MGVFTPRLNYLKTFPCDCAGNGAVGHYKIYRWYTSTPRRNDWQILEKQTRNKSHVFMTERAQFVMGEGRSSKSSNTLWNIGSLAIKGKKTTQGDDSEC